MWNFEPSLLLWSIFFFFYSIVETIVMFCLFFFVLVILCFHFNSHPSSQKHRLGVVDWVGNGDPSKLPVEVSLLFFDSLHLLTLSLNHLVFLVKDFDLRLVSWELIFHGDIWVLHHSNYLCAWSIYTSCWPLPVYINVSAHHSIWSRSSYPDVLSLAGSGAVYRGRCQLR